jgi:nitroimidazol reductase NimA-like FMN-containing flavoprotein (pyridoxamine 5'-phosphate oxidase superfamily)
VTTPDRSDHTDEDTLASIARQIIDSSLYMTLGTADGTGLPWASPVYYAVVDYTEFVWVSSPEATHSANLASRPQVSIVIFDSQVPIGTGQAVYMTAAAEELTGVGVDRVIQLFSRRSVAHGGSEWTRDDVHASARHRLYRAIASSHFVLGPQDQRLPVNVRGGAGGAERWP